MKFSRLFVWGPNPFTNRLIASHIESIAGNAPLCFCDKVDIDESSLNDSSVFFCDCDKVDALSYCRFLHQPGIETDRSPNVILMNVQPDVDLLAEIKTYSISGIFYTNDHFELIDKGIKKVLEGEHWLSRVLLVRSLQSVRNEARCEKGEGLPSLLTIREQEIIKMIYSGFDNQNIAEKLFISPNTVKTHVSNIYKKINVGNRVQAILWASANPGQLISPLPERKNGEHLAFIAKMAAQYEKGIR